MCESDSKGSPEGSISESCMLEVFSSGISVS